MPKKTRIQWDERVIGPFDFGWCDLWEPDQEYGKLKVTLRFDDVDLEDFLEDLRPAMEEAKQKLLAAEKLKPAQKKTLKDATLPVQDETRKDDDGEWQETGYKVIKLTDNGRIPKKDGTVWVRRIPVFNYKGKTLENKVIVTEGKVSVTVEAWVNEKNEAGIKLRPLAVQATKTAASGPRSAEDYGFSFEPDDDDEEETTEDQTPFDTEEEDDTPDNGKTPRSPVDF